MNLTLNIKRHELNSKNEILSSLVATNSVIKIIFNHTHILFSLIMFPFDWPGDFEEYMGFTFGLISPGSGSLSLECIFARSHSNLDFLYVQLLCLLLTPALVGLIFIICILLQEYIMKRNKLKKKFLRSSLKERRGGFLVTNFAMSEAKIIKKIVVSIRKKVSFEALILLVFMIASVDIFHAVGFTMFYVNIGYAQNKFQKVLWQPKIDFDSPSHQAWLFGVSVPAIILFGLLFPAYIMIRLLPLRRVSQGSRTIIMDEKNCDLNKLVAREEAKSEFFSRYGYFYYAYKPGCFYYEVFYILRKEIFIIFDIFLIPVIRIQSKYNPLTFLIIAIIVLWGFFLLHLKLRPYREEINSINKFETFSYVTQLTSYNIAALMLAHYLDISPYQNYTLGNRQYSPWIFGMLFMLTIALNTGFIVISGRLFFIYASGNIKLHLKKIYLILRGICRIRRFSFKRKMKPSERKERAQSERNSRKNPLLEWESEREIFKNEISHLKEDNFMAQQALKERQDQTANMEQLLKKKCTLLKLLLKENKRLKTILADRSFLANESSQKTPQDYDKSYENSFPRWENVHNFPRLSLPKPLTQKGDEFEKLSKFEKFETNNSEEGVINLVSSSSLQKKKMPWPATLSPSVNEIGAEEPMGGNVLCVTHNKWVEEIEEKEFFLRLDVAIMNSCELAIDALGIKEDLGGIIQLLLKLICSFLKVPMNVIVKTDENFHRMRTVPISLGPKERLGFSAFVRLIDFRDISEFSVKLELEGRYEFSEKGCPIMKLTTFSPRLHRKKVVSSTRISLNFSDFVTFWPYLKMERIPQNKIWTSGIHPIKQENTPDFVLISLDTSQKITRPKASDQQASEIDFYCLQHSQNIEVEDLQDLKSKIEFQYPKIILSQGEHEAPCISTGSSELAKDRKKRIFFSGGCLLKLLFLGGFLKLNLKLTTSLIRFEIFGDERVAESIKGKFRCSNDFEIYARKLLEKKFFFILQPERKGSVDQKLE